MNHGYDDDDEEFTAPLPQAPSFFSQSSGGGRFGATPSASSYDDYFKAYSVATMQHGHERPELMYGGKIIMPPSASIKLTSLDIDSPWTFHSRNPRNPTENQTYAGVLEFIAEEGIVHLPAWMMKKSNSNEGDPVRLTGAVSPKGKMVKIQAQSVDFSEVADAKAVLESALRYYSALTKGDIIEITYNSLVFEFSIMETTPEGTGISIIDTDLEVDFAPPVGYVEPERKAPAPIPTMADKSKIDVGETTSVDPSRPVSSMSIRTQGSGDGPSESFTGVGQSSSGKRIRGKGLAKKIEEVDPNSKINRFTGPRIITSDSSNDDRKVPAASVLPEGKFFFGYKYVPFDKSKVKKKEEAPAPPQSFQGQGNSSRRNAPSSSTPAPAAAEPAKEEKADPWANLGSGQTSSGRAPKRAAASPAPEPARAPSPPKQTEQDVIDATMMDETDFMFDDTAYSDDDDVIEIDSD